MKILFIRMASYFNETNHHPENVMMPVDIAFMASIADHAGHETTLIDTETTKYTIESLALAIASHNADLICMKAKSPSNAHIVELFSHAVMKGKDQKVIGFGHTFSTSDYFLNPDLPFLCTIHHEPELSFREILTSWNNPEALKSIKGISFHNGTSITKNPDMPLLDKLDELPSPKYEWFLNDGYYSYYPLPLFMKRKMAFMLASRGCPKKCIYCSPTLRQTSGTGMRFHSIDRIIRDMTFLQGNGISVIQFRDDILTLNNNFIRDLCHAIIKSKLKVKWMGQTHVNHVDPELLELMKKANCITIAFGLESGSKKVLQAIKKYNDLDHARKVFKACKKLRMKTVGFFLVGNPGETIEDVNLTRQLISELNPDLIQVALFTPYKGSPAYSLLAESDRKDEDNFHHYNKISHNFSAIRIDELEKLPKKIYLEYIFRPQNFLRLSLTSLADLFVNQKTILRLIVTASRFLFLRKVH